MFRPAETAVAGDMTVGFYVIIRPAASAVAGDDMELTLIIMTIDRMDLGAALDLINSSKGIPVPGGTIIRKLDGTHLVYLS